MELVETSFGCIPVWGDYGSHRPLVLMIRGIFPPLHRHADLGPRGADLALLHLPGFHSKVIRPISVDRFAQAFDELVRIRFPDREITLVGTSTGALVALAMTAPQVKAKLAVEPFFSTAKLWPLISLVRTKLQKATNPLLHEWMEAVLGYTLSGVSDRNYEHLAAQVMPTLVLAGDTPLTPVRKMTQLPSLCDPQDRARLPYKVVRGGHDIPVEEIRAALGDLARLAGQAPPAASLRAG